MSKRSTRSGAACLAGVVLMALLPAKTRAQPPVHTSATSAPDAELPARKRRARELFERGFALASRKAWELALSEFEESILVYPTRVAFMNKAVCLKQLGRPSEALEAYEELARQVPGTPKPEEHDEIARAKLELRTLVAEVVIVGDVENASVFVDGKARGTTPLSGPVYLDPGSHVIRLAKDGHDAIEVPLRVNAGERNVVRTHLPTKQTSRDLPVRPPPRAGRPSQPAVTAPVAPHPNLARRTIALEALVGLAVSASLRGDAEESCDDRVTLPTGASTPACRVDARPFGPALAARIAYSWGPAWSAHLSAGYVALERNLVRHVAADAQGVELSSDDLRDDLVLRAAFAAPGISYHVGHRFPMSAGLSAGLARGRVTASVRGSFHETEDASATPYGTLELDEEPLALWIPFMAPELRFGVRLRPDVSIALGAALWIAFSPDATRTGNVWNEEGVRSAELDVAASVTPRTATLPDERALGTFLVFVPSLSLRWEL